MTNNNNLFGLSLILAAILAQSCTDCRDVEPRIRLDNRSKATATVNLATSVDTANFFAILPDHTTEWRSWRESEVKVMLSDSTRQVVDSLNIELQNCHQYELVVDSSFHLISKIKHRK